MNLSDNQQAFLALVRAGLWADAGGADSRSQGITESRNQGSTEAGSQGFTETGKQGISDPRSLGGAGTVDWNEVYRLAEEQAVVGLVAAGLDHVHGVKIPQEGVLQFVGTALRIEQRNVEMNDFVVQLNKQLWQNKIYGLLVKGQGVAQCYERPLWRTCGDVDLLLDDDNYEKAKVLLIPLADEVEDEDPVKKHLALNIKGFDVELHGKMSFALSRKADKVIDNVIDDSLKRRGARVWSYKNSDIYLPNADNDVIIVFTHFLHHFFIEGVGVRQICDWCRLLWTYRDSLNKGLLESRIRKMGLMTEWQVFGALTVEYLGMPVEAMPFYDSRFTVKGERVLERILKSGNFGHNNDLSYRAKYSGMKYKIVALWRRLVDFVGLSQIFPLDAPRFFVTYVFGKV